MLDIAITQDGDFILKKNDLKTVTNDNLRFQHAMCAVKSITNDWFSDKKFGADLEEIIGMPCNKSIAQVGISKITTALTSNSIYSLNEIYVDYKLKKNVIEYLVYLRNEDKLTSKLLHVTLDLVKGVNVRMGRD